MVRSGWSHCQHMSPYFLSPLQPACTDGPTRRGATALTGLGLLLQPLQRQLDVLGVGRVAVTDSRADPRRLGEPSGTAVPRSLGDPAPAVGACDVVAPAGDGQTEVADVEGNTCPGSASVTVHMVLHRCMPLRLCPRNTAPGTAPSPLRHSIARASLARDARVGRSVIRWYTVSGLASIVTSACAEAWPVSLMRRSYFCRQEDWRV